MKKSLCLLLCLCMLPLLSACGSIYTNYKEIEQLLVIQTMGVDHTPNGVSLSLASGANPKSKNGVTRLFSDAPSITTAVERIRKHSFEEELFYGHISSVLLGEQAAKNGVDNYLMYICRAPDIRIDVPLYILKNSEAKDAVLNVGNGSNGITEIMSSIQQNLEWRGDGGLTRTADVVHDLRRHGSTLVCALEYTQAAEFSGELSGSEKSSPADQAPPGLGQSVSGGDNILRYQGYAIIRDGRLCDYIGREDAIGVSFLKNRVKVCDIIVPDRRGNTVTLEIDQGSSRIVPRWSTGGDLLGFDVNVEAEASIVEIDSGGLTSEESLNYILSQLESSISDRVVNILQLSRRYRADFLGLASNIEMDNPENFRNLQTDFDQLLPELDIRVRVEGRLRHTNDLKDE